MYVKKLKRKCNVRGCRCTDTFAISQTREIGNGVIVCKKCLKEALDAIDRYKPEPKTKSSGIPALFYNVAVSKVAEAPTEEANDKIAGEEVAEKVVKEVSEEEPAKRKKGTKNI